MPGVQVVIYMHVPYVVNVPRMKEEHDFSFIVLLFFILHSPPHPLSGERVMTGTCSSAGVGGQSFAPAPGYVFGPGGRRSDLPRPAQQVVYVFTTSLANR